MSDALPIALVINPTSRRGKGARVGYAVRQQLERQGVNYTTVVGSTPADCVERVRSCASSVRGFLLVGGDGLIGMLLQLEEFRSRPFGVLPTGSGNDFALTFGFSKDPERNIRELIAALDRPLAVDAGVAFPSDTDRSHWFASSIAIGLVARVNRRANAFRLPLGALGYQLSLLRELATGRIDAFSIATEPCGAAHTRPALLFAILNTPTLGGGIRLAPEASVADGELDLIEVRPATRRRVFSVLPKLITATHGDLPEVEMSRVDEVTLGGEGLYAYADGDYVGEAPIKVIAKPAALKVWAPVR